MRIILKIWVGALLAIAAGVSTLTLAGNVGTLSAEEYKKVSAAPKTNADHATLAKYYRALAAEHEVEEKAFNALAATYVKGLPGVVGGQARELGRAAKHAAEHARDFREVAIELAEIHEGIVEGPLK